MDDEIELLRQVRVEVVTLAFRAREVEHAYGPFEMRTGKRTTEC